MIGWLDFALLLPTGVPSSGFLSDCFVLATPELVFFFTIGVLGGNLHHRSQSHISCPTEFQIQLLILNAFFEGTNCLVIRHILHCVVQRDPSLDIISQSFIRFLNAALQFCQPCRPFASTFKCSVKYSGKIFPSINTTRR